MAPFVAEKSVRAGETLATDVTRGALVGAFLFHVGLQSASDRRHFSLDEEQIHCGNVREENVRSRVWSLESGIIDV